MDNIWSGEISTTNGKYNVNLQLDYLSIYKLIWSVCTKSSSPSFRNETACVLRCRYHERQGLRNWAPVIHCFHQKLSI